MCKRSVRFKFAPSIRADSPAEISRSLGDTMFNQGQAEDLLADIVTIRRTSADLELVAFLCQLESLVERLSEEAHGQIWFIGD
jgi:hypothetical protein